MFAPGALKLADFSLEEIEKYAILDDMGCIIGVKEDAPPDFKEAYEAAQKLFALWESLGID